ncbi:MAG: complex I subunit 5 family protein [Bacillota bacterium]|nr:complex I subunit 5 family protein [Bacillota bacterium]
MNICGVDLGFNFTGFQLIYTIVACIMWICSLLFSKEYMAHYENKKRYYIFMVATWIATVGVLASTNFLTTFIFFEIMSFTSYLLVIHEETPGPMKAGETYLAVAVIGGMVMLMGLFLLHDALGTLKFAELTAAKEAYLLAGGSSKRLFAAGLCILFGFGAKAGMVPLHIWLPKAHPIAPAPASALLSGILTKSGIFGAIVVSVCLFFENQTWGVMMASIGMVTMFLGALLGVFSIDLKRTLACSSVSQIGFITLGIGMIVLLGEENALASNGTILHMINHSMIKLLLFSAAGVVYMNLHKLNLNDIRGYGKNKPALLVLFAIGAASISGVPGTSGYISKTLLHESIVEYIEHAAHLGHAGLSNLFSVYEWVFLVTGGLTFCYMLKLFICIFIEDNKDWALREKYKNKYCMNNLSLGCLIVPAAILTIMGLTPYLTMNGIAAGAREFLHGFEAEHAVHYFTWVNLKGSIISLSIGAVLYLGLVRIFFMDDGVYKNLWPAKVDLEELVYRPLIALLLKPGIFKYIDGIIDNFRFMEWYHSHHGRHFKKFHEAYLYARDSMSFGLFLAAFGLAVLLVFMLISL